MKHSKGQFTLPSEENFYEETRELIERFGADGIRDSDGTTLPDNLKDLPGVAVYSTYFTSRGHNEFAAQHMFEASRYYLLSDFYTATSEESSFNFMRGYYPEQILPDYDHTPHLWWELRDRTTGQVVPPTDWEIQPEENLISFKSQPFHSYTLAFLAYGIWDPVQMYNHITNDWGPEVAHHIPFDVRYPESCQYVEDALEAWLAENPQTDIVRFTTFFYQFALIFNEEGKEKYVDWFGYANAVSPLAMEAFEETYGYRLSPEDFVDEGYYNSPFRPPSQAFLDYVDFTARFVAAKAKRLVDIVHAHGKKAVMFLGDHWIGVEPYGKYFKEIGLDGVVGSVGDGVTLRLISDIETGFTEGRFLPYFFPDTFYPGNDPKKEAISNWLQARRALLRSPLDRIGYGGYLSLAYQFPDFIDYIESLAQEYRDIYAKIKGSKPYCLAKVALLNCWGKLRSWGPYIVAHGKWYKLCYSYIGITEALAGMDVEVCFIDFEDVRQGIPEDIDVIINAGDAYTAFSGGEVFADAEIISELRRFVHAGGGLIGVGEPTALQKDGRFFQLADVWGVDKEIGYSQSSDKYFEAPLKVHFITEDLYEELDFGESCHNIYALYPETEIIEYSQHELHLAAHSFGQGRAVYIAGLPYSAQNTRLLKRAIAYASHKEADLKRYFAADPRLEVHAYPERGLYCICNNSEHNIRSLVYNAKGEAKEYEIAAGAIVWEEDNGLL